MADPSLKKQFEVGFQIILVMIQVKFNNTDPHNRKRCLFKWGLTAAAVRHPVWNTMQEATGHWEPQQKMTMLKIHIINP